MSIDSRALSVQLIQAMQEAGHHEFGFYAPPQPYKKVETDEVGFVDRDKWAARAWYVLGC